MEKVWDYCVKKLSFKSKPEQVKVSSETVQKESINCSIDQALGFSNSLQQNSSASGIGLSSSNVIPIVTKLITLTKICYQFAPKLSTLQKDFERKPIILPYQDDHKQLYKETKIKNVYQCKRENKYSLKEYPMAKLITDHTDTIICSNSTCMLASFHENIHRVDQGIYKKGQASQVYTECYEYLPTKQITFSEAQGIIDELKKEKYELFKNNCYHSSNKVIQKQILNLMIQQIQRDYEFILNIDTYINIIIQLLFFLIIIQQILEYQYQDKQLQIHFSFRRIVYQLFFTNSFCKVRFKINLIQQNMVRILCKENED